MTKQKGQELDYEVLKSGGFIMQTQSNLFTVRLRCPGGKVSAAKLRVAANIAEKYGRGEIHNSVRQSVEIPYVHYEHFEAVAAELKKVDWAVASCGPRIRVPTACGGCTWNPNGLMDTQQMSLEVDRHYFGTATGHHKFKISFAGCPIDCSRTREMDLGFQGIVAPVLVPDACDGCNVCVAFCEDKALELVDALPVRDDARCTYCGDCIKVCPKKAMAEERRGWLVRVGGKHGRHPIHAYEVARFANDAECLDLIGKTITWYQANAVRRERIGTTILRLGLARYLDEVVVPAGLEAITTAESRHKFWTQGNAYPRTDATIEASQT